MENSNTSVARGGCSAGSGRNIGLGGVGGWIVKGGLEEWGVLTRGVARAVGQVLCGGVD